MHVKTVLTMLVIAIAIVPPVFAHPGSNIVVDDEGRVFFLDTAAGVWQLDKTGELTLVSKLAWHWMAADREGRYARSRDSEYFNNVSIEGSKLILIPSSDFPVAIGSDGNLYYAKYNRVQPGEITFRRPDGTESPVVKLPEALPGSFVTGLTSAPDGTLYATVSNGAETSIWKIALDGTANKAFDWLAPESVRSDPLESTEDLTERTYARDLAVDAEGNIYLAASGIRSIAKRSPDGVVKILHTADAPWVPCGVALYDGEVYVLEYDVRGADRANWLPRVRKIAKDGGVTTLATVSRPATR